MDTSKYIFEKTKDSDKEIIKIPRESIFIGKKIYRIDFYYEDGIQELEVRGIEEYVRSIDPQTGEEHFLDAAPGETPDTYYIILGDGWSVSPYNKYLTKEDCYEASREEHLRYIEENQAMIERLQFSILNAKRRVENIDKLLSKLRS